MFVKFIGPFSLFLTFLLTASRLLLLVVFCALLIVVVVAFDAVVLLVASRLLDHFLCPRELCA